MRFSRWLVVIAGVLLLFSWPAVVQAAPKPITGLRIAPLRAYPSQNPGDTTSGSITLTNRTPKPQTVSLSAEVFKTTDQEYNYDFEPSATAQWIQFADKQVTLGVNQSQAVAYSVAVPANATPGGHFFVLLASLNPVISSSHVNEISRVASLVYLQVNGQLNKQSRLLSASLPWFSAKPSIPLVTQVADSGNTYIQARIGVYATRQPFGQSVSLAQLNTLILPSTVHKVSGTVALPNVPGLYKVDTQYSSPTGTPMTISHYVLYVPLWLGLVIVAGLVAGGLVIRRRLQLPPPHP
jgi:hypothetical protein